MQISFTVLESVFFNEQTMLFEVLQTHYILTKSCFPFLQICMLSMYYLGKNSPFQSIFATMDQFQGVQVR